MKGLYLKTLISTIILLYTSLCACFYDPIVSVDDTPRTPFFNEVVGNVSFTSLLNGRQRSQDFNDNKLLSCSGLKTSIILKLLSNKLKYNTIKQKLFLSLSHNENVIIIRAPSWS